MAARVPLQFVKPTMRLARPICDAEGRLVAGMGTLLTDRIVRLLRTMAIQAVVVQDAGQLNEWETVRPLDEDLALLGRRFRREAPSPPLAALEQAIRRHLRRRAAALEAEHGAGGPDGSVTT